MNEDLKKLEAARDRAYKAYDRGFRNLAANDEECDDLYRAWMKAQAAWEVAEYGKVVMH
jgi:hypothetical protein